ncbi:MAG: DUF3990 domain-containing protein [Bacteroides sp.]|nr:DUF3990 domain-containing protein [Bacteroides sp.]
MLTVYHGATCEIKQPLCSVGRPNLDFGQGFYVTDLREQAVSWAQRQGVSRGSTPLLNVYELDVDHIRTAYRRLCFEAYDEAWLNFIANNRRGAEAWRGYDFIEGGVADDRVVDTVNLYLLGLMTADVALERLAQHVPNNQICLLNQGLVSECLHYVNTELLNTI